MVKFIDFLEDWDNVYYINMTKYNAKYNCILIRRNLCGILGNDVIELVFSKGNYCYQRCISYFHNGVTVCANGKYNFINKTNGKLLYNEWFDTLYEGFSSSNNIVSTNKGYFLVDNESAHIYTKPYYKLIPPFGYYGEKNVFFAYDSKDKFSIINENDEKYIDMSFDNYKDISPYCGAYYEVYCDGKWYSLEDIVK